MKKMFAILLIAVMMLSICVCTAETGTQNRYIFEMVEGHQQYVEGETFDGDVIISGDYAQVTFVGCVFNGDIINKAEEWTRVMLLGCEVNGKCIIENGLKEGTMETPLPKFMTDAPVEVVCEDCLGAVIPLGDFEVVFNGQTYTIADSTIFYDNGNPEAGYVPYEGQEASVYWVGQWWENGEQIILIGAELE